MAIFLIVGGQKEKASAVGSRQSKSKVGYAHCNSTADRLTDLTADFRLPTADYSIPPTD
ncbi:MAG: hypothetical protein HZA78_08000 [Candidatus Schekmanbacteria bacterium]|nr:hypothetical protein [Candidatus Schekmanbacteria bacterium]